MNYRPRHPQPFTFEAASGLETVIIMQEISRLQSSLVRLKSTQVELEPYYSDDKDLKDAYDENELVILSQTERVSMLKLVLQTRGISSEHYNLRPLPTSTPTSALIAESNISDTAVVSQGQRQSEPEENGLFL